eukprot:6469618-Amphidinium_carterae.1
MAAAGLDAEAAAAMNLSFDLDEEYWDEDNDTDDNETDDDNAGVSRGHQVEATAVESAYRKLVLTAMSSHT